MEDAEKKMFHTIGEVAEMFGESQPTLRFWEKEFGFPKPRTNAKGTRYYSKEDIEEVRTVHHLLRGQKLTIEGAKEKLKSNKKDDVKRNAEVIGRLEKIKQELLGMKNELN